MLITDANNLAVYYTGDGYVDPPPPCGLAVPDQIATSQLLLDCIALLEAKDALRGAGTLNWSADKAITTWDGVSTNATGSEGAASGETGTATHVTKVELVNKGLTGSVPESLGKVERLTTLKLSGNTLTGCLPSELRDVAQSDLSQLDLKYCDPGAPGPITGVVTRTSIALSWGALEDASAYRIEYVKAVLNGVWAVADSTLTTTSYTMEGLECGSSYRFRMSALGSGPDVEAVWSDPSLSVRTETAPCKPPAPEPGR